MARTYRSIPQLTPQEIKRFWSYIDKTPGYGPQGTCWIWIGGKFDCGYGAFSIRDAPFYANRVSYRLHHNQNPGAMFVCHHCDNPPCCNPEHLFLGTTQDNTADRHKKGRSASGDNSGSRLHPERRARGDRSGPRLHPERYLLGDRHWTRQHPERLQGANNPNHRFNDAVKAQAVQDYKDGRSAGYIHAAYGISKTHFYRILKNLSSIKQ